MSMGLASWFLKLRKPGYVFLMRIQTQILRELSKLPTAPGMWGAASLRSVCLGWLVLLTPEASVA